MLLCFHKYIFQPSKAGRYLAGEEKQAPEMVYASAAGGQAAESCPYGCCHSPCLRHPGRTDSNHRVAAASAASARSSFAKFRVPALFPNPNFTNHESLPPLSDAFSDFAAAFPEYCETQQADRIRDREYGHLAGHVCLDYSGVNLFSHAQMNAPEVSPLAAASAWQPPFFGISYKSASLKSEIERGEHDSGFEFAVRQRIMSFLKVSGEDYGMVSVTNRTAAFRLLGETYPFHSNKKLLTVYDYESEAVSAIIESAEKRGAKTLSSSFCWPGLRIQSTKLKGLLSRRKTEKKMRGLLVFPHMSRMSGARYPYLWMKFARENGWHVALDACTLGPKDMDTLGIRLIEPDFIICSFFKVVGENPSGFAGLFIKKSSLEVLQTSIIARSIGIVSIVPAQRFSDMAGEEMDTTSSFSGPIKNQVFEPMTAEEDEEDEEEEEEEEEGGYEDAEGQEELSSEIVEVESQSTKDGQVEVQFSGLDHADSLGLTVIHNRLRCLTNWLVIALKKLQHPHSENCNPLVKIYGPQVKFDRGPALAFNVFDWKGEKINPLLVQKLADRSNISLSCGFLHKIMFSEKYDQFRDSVLEKRAHAIAKASGSKKTEIHQNLGISVVNASFGYLANFADAYQLWEFVAKFLDADFVEKERWRYVALNQKTIEL